MDPTRWIFLLAFCGILIVFGLFIVAGFVLLVRPWLRAAMSGTPVSLFQIVGMRLRGNPPILLIDAYMVLKRGGNSATIVDLENAYISARNRIDNCDDLVSMFKKG